MWYPTLHITSDKVLQNNTRVNIVQWVFIIFYSTLLRHCFSSFFNHTFLGVVVIFRNVAETFKYVFRDIQDQMFWYMKIYQSFTSLPPWDWSNARTLRHCLQLIYKVFFCEMIFGVFSTRVLFLSREYDCACGNSVFILFEGEIITENKINNLLKSKV